MVSLSRVYSLQEDDILEEQLKKKSEASELLYVKLFTGSGRGLESLSRGTKKNADGESRTFESSDNADVSLISSVRESPGGLAHPWSAGKIPGDADV